MTLDEAIRYYQEEADDHEINAEMYKIIIEEDRQLAKWLKELKEYKDARIGCEYCKHNYREQYERPCSLCQRNFMDMFERRVNADDHR